MKVEDFEKARNLVERLKEYDRLYSSAKTEEKVFIGAGHWSLSLKEEELGDGRRFVLNLIKNRQDAVRQELSRLGVEA